MVGDGWVVAVFDNKSSPEDVGSGGCLKSDVVNIVFDGILIAASPYSTGNHRLNNFEMYLFSSISSINFYSLN